MLQKIGRSTQHPPACQVEAKVKARELERVACDEGGQPMLFAVRLEVVEAVVEGRVAGARLAVPEVGPQVLKLLPL